MMAVLKLLVTRNYKRARQRSGMVLLKASLH